MLQNKKDKPYNVEGYIFTGRTNVPAGGVSAITIQVASSFDFFAEKLSYVCSTAVAGIIPRFDVQIQRDQTNMFQDYVPSYMLAGMGINTNAPLEVLYPVGQANWFNLSKPFKFNASCNIIISIRNTCSQAIAVVFSLSGYKHVYAV